MQIRFRRSKPFFFLKRTHCWLLNASAIANPPLQVIMYSTVMGSIGALYPFTSREDVDFFTHLEMHLRQVRPQPLDSASVELNL